VRELLDTKLLDVDRLGVNSAFLSPFGHRQQLLRNPATLGNATQRDRLDAVGRSLLCAQRLLNDSDRWWLADGALIGVYRHSAMLPHDEDADIMMPRPDFERFVARLERWNVRLAPFFYTAADRAVWQRLSPKIAYYSDGDSCAVMRRPNDVLVAQIVDVPTGFYTDVWVGDVVDDDSMFRYEFGRRHTLPLDDIFPLQSARLGSLHVPVPRNVTAYLRQTYGDFAHPYSRLMVLALFTSLPGGRQWVALLVAVSAGSCALELPSRRLHVLLLGVATVALLFSANCAGRFAILGAPFSVAVACFHAPQKRSAARLAGLCSASLLLLACGFALKTCLAMLVDGYEFRDGDKTASLLDSPFFHINYRAFWSG
jgi:hypothetical protein